MPSTSMASFMTSWWYSLQKILLVAPRAATPLSFLPVRVTASERRPLTRMICTTEYALAMRWRIIGSWIAPLAFALAMTWLSSVSKRR